LKHHRQQIKRGERLLKKQSTRKRAHSNEHCGVVEKNTRTNRGSFKCNAACFPFAAASWHAAAAALDAVTLCYQVLFVCLCLLDVLAPRREESKHLKTVDGMEPSSIHVGAHFSYEFT
jgi:hypothetical protein